LGSKEEVLLALTLLVSVMTLGTGRTTVLQGAVHLAILAAFLYLADSALTISANRLAALPTPSVE
jgi:Ca2+/H+ antiporter